MNDELSFLVNRRIAMHVICAVIGDGVLHENSKIAGTIPESTSVNSSCEYFCGSSSSESAFFSCTTFAEALKVPGGNGTGAFAMTAQPKMPLQPQPLGV